MEYNDLSKPASAATRQIHQAMKTLLDFDDPHEKECALRNCLKKVENLEIKNAEGEVIWSQRIACLDQPEPVPQRLAESSDRFVQGCRRNFSSPRLRYVQSDRHRRGNRLDRLRSADQLRMLSRGAGLSQCRAWNAAGFRRCDFTSAS